MRVSASRTSPNDGAYSIILFYFIFMRMKMTFRNWNNEMKFRDKVRVITCWIFGHK